MWIYRAASGTICLRRSQGYDVEAREPFHTGPPILEEANMSTARTSAVLAIVALCVPLPLCAAGFDRVELNVPDPPAAARWYANHLGGRLVQLESAPAVAFGKITLSFAKADGLISDSVGAASIISASRMRISTRHAAVRPRPRANRLGSREGRPGPLRLHSRSVVDLDRGRRGSARSAASITSTWRRPIPKRLLNFTPTSSAAR